MGRRRLRMLSYADDIALIVDDEEVMREMLKLLRWLRGKGLELNAKKIKMMIFRKAGGGKKKYVFKWNEEILETVKSFDYLGYTLKENNKEGEHINTRVGKASGVLGRI